jgi:putative (di)nucleoside polyphosphate hydrolase
VGNDRYFRAGVGLLLVDRKGRVLALERADLPGAWQAPQGGIQKGEEPIDAARRELAEETGIEWAQITLLDEYPEWLAYELPSWARSDKTGRGQAQRWFLLRFEGTDETIQLPKGGHEAEFASWKWIEPSELADIAWIVKQPIYRRLLAYWHQHLAGLDQG